MKNGMASSKKARTPCTIRCTIDISGMLRYIAVAIEAAVRTKVIGILRISRVKKPPIRMVVATAALLIELSPAAEADLDFGIPGVDSRQVHQRVVEHHHGYSHHNHVAQLADHDVEARMGDG